MSVVPAIVWISTRGVDPPYYIVHAIGYIQISYCIECNRFRKAELGLRSKLAILTETRLSRSRDQGPNTIGSSNLDDSVVSLVRDVEVAEAVQGHALGSLKAIVCRHGRGGFSHLLATRTDKSNDGTGHRASNDSSRTTL